MGNYCYVAVCSAALGASAPTEGGEGRGHTVAAARLQLVPFSLIFISSLFNFLFTFFISLLFLFTDFFITVILLMFVTFYCIIKSFVEYLSTPCVHKLTLCDCHQQKRLLDII